MRGNLTLISFSIREPAKITLTNYPAESVVSISSIVPPIFTIEEPSQLFRKVFLSRSSTAGSNGIRSNEEHCDDAGKRRYSCPISGPLGHAN